MQISPTYIKQSYALAWTFFINNKKVSFLAMFILGILAILSAISTLGMIIYIGMLVLLFSLSIYVAKTFKSSNNEDEYKEKVQNTRIKELLTKYFSAASGGLLGLIVVEFIFAFFIVIMLTLSIGMEALSHLNDPNMPVDRQLEIFQSIGITGIVLMLIMTFFAYINPIVLGNLFASKGFGQAFDAIFTMFSPRVWRASFKGPYFLIVSMLHLTAIGVTIVSMLCMMTIVLIPIAVFIVYMFVLYFTITSVVAREMAFKQKVEVSSVDE